MAETQLNQLASLREIPIASVIVLKGTGDCAEVIKAHLYVLFDTSIFIDIYEILSSYLCIYTCTCIYVNIHIHVQAYVYSCFVANNS